MVEHDVEPQGAMSWIVEPVGGVRASPDEGALEGLAGMDVNQAALRVTAAGWLVRAHERQAILTLDYRPNRANLVIDHELVVREVRIG